MLRADLALRTTTLALSLHATEDERPDGPAYLAQRRLSGATLALDHRALEATPMAGARRGLALAGSASHYPSSFGSLSGDLDELRAQLELYTPLPVSRRHTLLLRLRARRLYFEHGTARLLDVGGAAFGSLFESPRAESLPSHPGLPPQRRFSEPLRGFETAPFSVDRIGVADLRYRYPIIVDRGTATSLWILPAFFLSQIDLELFGSAASSDPKRLRERGHLAAGGALVLRFSWFIPWLIQYQLSKRWTDDLARQHLVSFGSDLDLGV